MNAAAAVLDINCGHLIIDKSTREVTANGQIQKLTAREMHILLLLLDNPNIVLSKAELLEKIWGYDYYGESRAVDNQIRRLRKKIEVNPSNPQYIMTKWGQGYYFKV